MARTAYDRNGNAVHRKDPAGNGTSYEYDLDNLLVRRLYADGTAESYRRDHAGYIDDVTNARGQVNDYAYDSMHQMTGIEFGDASPAVRYEYDAFGRLVMRQDGVGTARYGYDAESHLTESDGPLDADTLRMQYDATGRLTHMVVGTGTPVEYAYDTQARITTVTHGADTFALEYAGASPSVQAVVHPSGARTTLSYDALNRLIAVTNRSSNLSLISSYVYTYDNADRRSSETVSDGLSLPVASDHLSVSSYNKVNQLLAATDRPAAYSYDADGNQTRGYTRDGYQFTATYDTEDHLTTLEYIDDAGHVLRNEYAYDGDGWLARSMSRDNGVVTRDRRFVYGSGLLLEQRNEQNQVLDEYAWDTRSPGGVGGLLARRSEGMTYSYLYDGRGNVTGVLDSASAVVAAYRYDPFGSIVSESGSHEQAYKFSTKPQEPLSGLYYFGYRHYSPREGRWITRDPIREQGGANLYSFVESDPVNFIDPWGLKRRGKGKGGGSGKGGESSDRSSVPYAPAMDFKEWFWPWDEQDVRAHNQDYTSDIFWPKKLSFADIDRLTLKPLTVLIETGIYDPFLGEGCGGSGAASGGTAP